MCAVDILSLGTLNSVTVVGVFAGLTVCAVDVLSLGTLTTVTVVGAFAGLTVCAVNVLGMTREFFLNDHFRHHRHLKDFPDNNNEDSEYNKADRVREAGES